MITFLLLSSCFLAKLRTEEIPTSETTETEGLAFDVNLLKKFSSIKFFLHIPACSKTLSTKLDTDAIQELKQWGQVIMKALSIQNLQEDTDFLRSPSLTYEIKELHDIQGKALSLFQASLTFEASVTVEKNKQYGQGILWSKKCFFKGDTPLNLEKAFSQTFALLLHKFEKDYLKANQNNPIKPIFYIIE